MLTPHEQYAIQEVVRYYRKKYGEDWYNMDVVIQDSYTMYGVKVSERAVEAVVFGR